MFEKQSSEAVAKNLARLRGETKTSIRQLVTGLVAQEMPISPSGISDIEHGRRQVSVDQLTALAAALGVSPMTLLMPYVDDPDEEVVLAGTSYERAEDMVAWLRGERSLSHAEMDDWEREGFRRQANPIWERKKAAD